MLTWVFDTPGAEPAPDELVDAVDDDDWVVVVEFVDGLDEHPAAIAITPTASTAPHAINCRRFLIKPP
jgi:hypothetical protein